MSSKRKPSKPITDNPDETRLSRGRNRPEAIFPIPPLTSSLPESYAATLQEIKAHLRSARIRAVLAANPIVIEAYWQTGKIILARQQEAGWGAKVIDRLAEDLQAEFPDMSGLTSRNLLSMKIFAREFPDGPIAKQPVSQLPWGQIIRLMQSICSADIYPIRPANAGLHRSYLVFLLLSERFLEYAIRNSERGKIPEINRDALLTYEALIPSPAEQHRIAECLSSLDALNTAETQKLEALKTHKRGLMQQLFPTCHLAPHAPLRGEGLGERGLTRDKT